MNYRPSFIQRKSKLVAMGPMWITSIAFNTTTVPIRPLHYCNGRFTWPRMKLNEDMSLNNGGLHFTQYLKVGCSHEDQSCSLQFSVNPYFQVLFLVTHFQVPLLVTHFQVPFLVTHFQVPSLVTHFQVPFLVTHFQVPFLVTYFQISFRVTHFQVPFLDTGQVHYAKSVIFHLYNSNIHPRCGPR